MKTILLLLIVAILATTIVVAENINDECVRAGFDSGVAKWEWDNGWIPEGDAMGTIASGTDTNPIWNVGSSGATGIIVKGGNIDHGGVFYTIYGTSGTFSQDNPATSHITFCKDDQTTDVPEFTVISASLVLIATGGYMYFKRN